MGCKAVNDSYRRVQCVCYFVVCVVVSVCQYVHAFPLMAHSERTECAAVCRKYSGSKIVIFLHFLR